MIPLVHVLISAMKSSPRMDSPNHAYALTAYDSAASMSFVKHSARSGLYAHRHDPARQQATLPRAMHDVFLEIVAGYADCFFTARARRLADDGHRLCRPESDRGQLLVGVEPHQRDAAATGELLQL